MQKQKLSQRALKILYWASQHRDGLSGMHTGYVSGSRAKPYGGATLKTYGSLRKQGLMELNSRNSSMIWIGNGRVDHSTEWIFRLTEEGREVAGKIKRGDFK